MKNTQPNHLIHETSPYLLQHAYNPVDWHPWGDEALQKAKADNHLIVISIGYSACHWCHVMEKESFEDQEVAAIMNKGYVSIKIDREERPDIDQVYMQAAYLIMGSGGWPLNIIALPDGRPVYAGTYFQKTKWIQILEYFSEMHTEQPDLIIKQAENISDEMLQSSRMQPAGGEKNYSKEHIQQIYSGISSKIDPEKGGTYGAPKFPMPVVHEYLLHYHLLSGNNKPLELVDITLKKMAAGGIYDQLGGGFCRYATDANWKVPHFEKMLYDNAQLLSLYSNAFKLSRDPEYADVIRKTISFAEEVFSAPGAGFYSALDADSEGEEGLFYIWKKEEILKVAGHLGQEFCQYYHVEENGNWEYRYNILYRNPETENASSDASSFLSLNNKFSPIRSALLKIRAGRQKPGLDDKILTSWNALMITGLLNAYNALGDQKYLDRALANARFLEEKMISEDYRLSRNYKNGKASINAFLDDYAFLSDALINLYQATFDEHWLYLSRHITDYAIKHFYGPENKQFFYTSSLDPGLILRPVETSDNVIPAASSRMLGNLLILSRYFNREDYLVIAEDLMAGIKHQLLRNPAFLSAWASHILSHYYPNIDIVIIGPRVEDLQKEISKYYLPGILLAGAKKSGTLSLFEYKYIEGKTLIYVCIDKSCKQPVESVKAAMEIINARLSNRKPMF